MLSTITDVARAAGVSISTVSHVVNGTRPVSPATRRRVESAIETVGYLQDGVARALRRQRTDSVGLVVSDSGQTAFAEMVRGVESEARAASMTVILADSREDRELEALSLRSLRERRVDGLLVARVSGSSAAPLAELRTQGLPVVLMDRLAKSGFDQVGVNTVEPMRAVVAHLIQKGHTRIGMVAGDLGVPTLQERFRGYATAILNAGMELRDDLLVTKADTAEAARAGVAALLDQPLPPTALVSSSVVLSAGALRAIQDARLSVPGDIALAAFDDFPYADLFTPRITSVVQSAFSVGREAMRLLLRRIEEPAAEAVTLRLDPVIAHRESCGCPPGAGPIEWRRGECGAVG